jgi:hypothetical protein
MENKNYHIASALVSMNDCGIKAMVAGNQEEARAIFQQALRRLRQEMALVAPIPEEDSTILESYATGLHARLQTAVTLTVDASFDFFDIAFSIQCNKASGANLPLGAAAILYNLALNDHLEFLTSGRSLFLRSATNFYKKALRILFSLGEARSEEEQCGRKCLFILALCNNLGHCYANLCDNKGTESCQDQLSAILRDPDCAGALAMEEFEFFQLNAVVSRVTIKTAAAA